MDDTIESIRAFFAMETEYINSIVRIKTASGEMEESIEQTTVKMEMMLFGAEKIKTTKTELLSGMGDLSKGLSSISGAFNTLKIGSDSFRNSLQQVAAGVQIVVGTAQAIKGVTTIMKTLNAALRQTTIFSTMASVAANPLVGLGIAAAAGAAGGYLLSQMSQTESNQVVNNVTFNPPPGGSSDQATAMYMVIGGPVI